MAAESATHFAILDPRKVVSYGQKHLEGQLNLFWGMYWGTVLQLHLSVITWCYFSFTLSLLVLILYGLYVVCLQVILSLRSMEHYSLWKVVVWTRIYHYHFLPSSAKFCWFFRTWSNDYSCWKLYLGIWFSWVAHSQINTAYLCSLYLDRISLVYLQQGAICK